MKFAGAVCGLRSQKSELAAGVHGHLIERRGDSPSTQQRQQ
jgi:hypothetical protein